MPSTEMQISRVTSSKEKAKIMYNKMSNWYDLFARFERKYRLIGLQKLDTKKGEIILKVGFGTGHSILALAKSAGESRKVFGIDISENMLAITKSHIVKADLNERVELICSDAGVSVQNSLVLVTTILL